MTAERHPERSAPPSRRPGGRTARVRADVLTAAGDLLAESGLASLDLGQVAVRAGVGRSTVYRRWRTMSGLVADLLDEMAESSRPRSDTGSLVGDLRANARLVQQTLTHPRQGPLFRALIASAAADAHTAAALQHFYRIRIREWTGCVVQAVERGEIPDGTDPAEVVRAVSAPLYYRMLTTDQPLTGTDADRAAEAAHAAALAGVFVSG